MDRTPSREAAARLPAVPQKFSRLQRRLADTDVLPFEVQMEDGTVHRFAGGRTPPGGGAQFRVVVRNPSGLRAFASLDELQLGEAYLDGDIDIEGEFLCCLDLRPVLTDRHPLQLAARHLVPLIIGQRRADLAGTGKHYDLGTDFYFAFLDTEFHMYSQALYTSEHESLEQAVRNKLEYITGVCRMESGMHVLDVGGGWGSFERFAGPRGVSSTMLTVSREQYAYLDHWSGTHGMPCQMKVIRESIFAYEAAERYDAIVLLGVMEHLPDYPRLFARFARLLRPGGRVYMDFAAQKDEKPIGEFVARYVFKGNHRPVYLPGLFKGAVANGFEPIALHNDRHSYYLTLQAWARNLEAARDRVVPLVGERAYRIFRLYLWGCARQLQRDGSLESYRVAFQLASGRSSSEIGLR
jgi:cyclopropane-fatty-acyl-phospholipid synthase